jgi:hypothetical protein
MLYPFAYVFQHLPKSDFLRLGKPGEETRLLAEPVDWDRRGAEAIGKIFRTFKKIYGQSLDFFAVLRYYDSRIERFRTFLNDTPQYSEERLLSQGKARMLK